MATACGAAAGSNWALRRHVFERCFLGDAAFMQQLLSADDWALWQQQKDGAI
ncbi:ketosteroid isomerase-like protein [Hymenobacter sp. UYP22]